MADDRKSEILLIEPGTEYVTEFKPYTVKSELSKSLAGIKTVIIGKDITAIGEEAFKDCTGLTHITIPSSVTRIGDHAFHECSSLTQVDILAKKSKIGISENSFDSGVQLNFVEAKPRKRSAKKADASSGEE